MKRLKISVAVCWIVAFTGCAFPLSVEQLEGHSISALPTSTSTLEIAAAKGDAKSQHDLAILYAAGVALPQNNEQALYWLRKSAAQDYAPAQHYLGAFYYDSEFVEQDLEQARFWFSKAAQQGYAPALKAMLNF